MLQPREKSDSCLFLKIILRISTAFVAVPKAETHER